MELSPITTVCLISTYAVLSLGPWLSLRTNSQSMILTLNLESCF